MTLVKRNNNVLNTLPGLFDDFFTRDLFDWNNGNNAGTGHTLPAVNVLENSENFVVEMAAPGMSKADFRVELDNNLLTISAERNEQKVENEGERYTRKEFNYQSFKRSFQLAKDVVDVENILAKYENGVLHLTIPQKEEIKQKPARLINIL